MLLLMLKVCTLLLLLFFVVDDALKSLNLFEAKDGREGGWGVNKIIFTQLDDVAFFANFKLQLHIASKYAQKRAGALVFCFWEDTVHSSGCGFESRHELLHGSFFTFICYKIVVLFEND